MTIPTEKVGRDSQVQQVIKSDENSDLTVTEYPEICYLKIFIHKIKTGKRKRKTTILSNHLTRMWSSMN